MRDRDAPETPEDTVLDGVAGAHGAPSELARERLSDALRDRAGAYRHDAAVDLTLVEALLRLDEPEAAVRQLDDHRASLQAMARDLQVVVADAAVEREAERVYRACADALTPPQASRSVLRRRVLAVAGAAAVALALLLPSGRISPRTTLANLVDRRTSLDDLAAARQRLQVARDRARSVREDAVALDAAPPPRVTASSDDLVRDKVRAILAADTSGGSAAATLSGSSTVTDIDDQREKRRKRGTDEPRKEPDAIAPVVPLRDRVPQPQPAEPLKANLPVSEDAVPDAGGELDQP